jgi:hypothetical protein
MSTLQFIRQSHLLRLFDSQGNSIGEWEAYNNVDSRSKGIWPDGTYSYDYWVPHAGDDENSSYGTRGVLVFDVPHREGMGIHAGRRNRPDGRGRSGPAHATMGCIRTTETAMAVIVGTQRDDPLTTLDVG